MERRTGRPQPVLLFDGICNLCNSSVQFILKHEKNSELKFAALQSQFGQELLSQYKLTSPKMNSVILVSDGKVYLASDAVIRVCRFLKFPWNLGSVLIVIPRPLRDFFYKKIAKNRYRWFGKKESCMVPSPGRRSRFLE
jgi:predicted DCC family thiol-disulfide oxidoreductase YuxK